MPFLQYTSGPGETIFGENEKPYNYITLNRNETVFHFFSTMCRLDAVDEHGNGRQSQDSYF